MPVPRVLTSRFPRKDPGHAQGKTLWEYAEIRIAEVLSTKGDIDFLVSHLLLLLNQSMNAFKKMWYSEGVETINLKIRCASKSKLVFDWAYINYCAI